MIPNEMLLTIGEISDRLEEPVTRCQYIVAKHRIKPVRRCGIIRLFDVNQVDLVKECIKDLRPYVGA